MKWLFGVVAVLLFIAAIAVGSAWWLLYTEPGLHWAAARAEGAAQGLEFPMMKEVRFDDHDGWDRQDRDGGSCVCILTSECTFVY